MNSTKLYKIILADDHILLRDALANLISDFKEFTVVAKAANGFEVINLMEKNLDADILLMDLNMPVMDGYETTNWMVKHHPGVKIVILTMYNSELAMIRLLQVGVKGFLKKDIHPFELNTALLKVAAGEYYYGNQGAEKIVSVFTKKEYSYQALEKSVLDDKEVEFLKLSATELSYRQIAVAMNIPPNHIDTLRQKIFKKAEVESRVGLVLYAIKNGIISF
jgi:two-component system, NarL family, invasion response regulator UvrY